MVLVSWIAQAQRIRFADTSNKWMLAGIAWGDPGHEVSYSQSVAYITDTMIANRSYHRLNYTNAERLAVREDTSHGKLYFRFITSFWQATRTDTLEHVLFDYNLKVNDSFIVAYSQYRFAFNVQSIDSVRLGAHFYRRWHMRGVGDYDFVEGLGTSEGPLFSVYPRVFEGGFQLRCFNNQGYQPPCSPPLPLPYAYMHVWMGIGMAAYFDNDSSCIFSPAAVGVGNVYVEDLPALFPNPGGRESVLRLPSTAGLSVLSISDLTGRRIVHASFAGKRDIPIGLYLSKPGIYYYTLQDAATRHRYIGKFIFQ